MYTQDLFYTVFLSFDIIGTSSSFWCSRHFQFWLYGHRPQRDILILQSYAILTIQFYLVVFYAVLCDSWVSFDSQCQ